MNPTTVVRARQKGVTGYVNVSRPTIFGNPYKVGEVNSAGKRLTLQDVLRLYTNHLNHFMQDDEFRAAALALRGKTIGCQCAGAEGGGIDPETGAPRCHAAILASVIDSWEEGGAA